MRYHLALSVLLFFPTLVLADVRVQFAKSLPAQAYDATLPAVPVEQWLAAHLPQGVTAHWGEFITDCGEQTGDPAVDRQRDMPLCAEVELKRNDKLVGYLLLAVGTSKKGVSREQAGLFFGVPCSRAGPTST